MTQLDGAPKSLLHLSGSPLTLPASRQGKGFTSSEDPQDRTRRRNVVRLLETLNDALAGPSSGDMPGSRGDRLLLMSDLYRKGSYAELERCLKVLLASYPHIHWHTTQRFRDRQHVSIVCGYKRQGKGIGKVYLPEISRDWPYHTDLLGLLETIDSRKVRVRVSRWPSKGEIYAEAEKEMTEKGVAWLAQSMRGPVQLPVEFLEAA